MSTENLNSINQGKISATFSEGFKSMITERNLLEDAHSSENRNSFPPQEEIDVESITQFQNDVDDESDECGEEHLRIRNTPSYRCFIKVELSNSSLLNSKLYHFPPLEDPGIDEVYFFQGKINQKIFFCVFQKQHLLTSKNSSEISFLLIMFQKLTRNCFSIFNFINSISHFSSKKYVLIPTYHIL